MKIDLTHELLELCRELLAEYEGGGYCASDELIKRAHTLLDAYVLRKPKENLND